MKFNNAFLGARHLRSSSFVRWQGSLDAVSSRDFAVSVNGDALLRTQFDPGDASQIVLGTTIPQAQDFYGAPWVAAQLGMTGVSGPDIAQACATSVACLIAAAQTVEVDGETTFPVVTSDRTSNEPLLVYPRSPSAGGALMTDQWGLADGGLGLFAGCAAGDTGAALVLSVG